MSKFNSKIIVLLAMAFMFYGCAGLSANAHIMEDDPLRNTVPESFHFNLQNPSVRNYLKGADPSALSPDRELEIYLLQELAAVKDEKGLGKAFDRLWEEHKTIGELINHPQSRPGFTYPLVEIYYLLSAVPDQNWQRQTRERLFQETLRDIKPHQISGYALHLYTLALLKNGKYHIAQPFLLRLERFVTPSIYLEDLTVALDYVMDGKDYSAGSQIMARICQAGTRDNIKFPDKTMCKAISAMIEAGKFELIRDTLTPLVNDNPDLQEYLFVKLLRENPVPVTVKTSVKHKKLMVEVQVIKAGKNSEYIDPELMDIGESLKETLNFSSFRLAGKKTFHLQTGETGEMTLPEKNLLRIVPISLDRGKSRIDVSIVKDHHDVFHTVVESVDGGVTTIGGPKTNDGLILLRVATNGSG
ncbi:MAG: hypothetical protein DRH24_09780 [Deltaproteobacteria bacterium]|nr:MAG: hypothetical protein DRH24_09780 [Deltaproteobacteria bacterium]